MCSLVHARISPVFLSHPLHSSSPLPSAFFFSSIFIPIVMKKGGRATSYHFLQGLRNWGMYPAGLHFSVSVDFFVFSQFIDWSQELPSSYIQPQSGALREERGGTRRTFSFPFLSPHLFPLEIAPPRQTHLRQTHLLNCIDTFLSGVLKLIFQGKGVENSQSLVWVGKALRKTYPNTPC